MQRIIVTPNNVQIGHVLYTESENGHQFYRVIRITPWSIRMISLETEKVPTAEYGMIILVKTVVE